MVAIEEHGGRLRSSVAEIPNCGQVVEFEDPDGNVVCAMQYVLGNPRSAVGGES